MSESVEAAAVRSDVQQKNDRDWSVLATYNSECRRGIVHTPEWDALMADEQERYNAETGGDTSGQP